MIEGRFNAGDIDSTLYRQAHPLLENKWTNEKQEGIFYVHSRVSKKCIF